MVKWHRDQQSMRCTYSPPEQLLPFATKLRRLCVYTGLSFCSQVEGSTSVRDGIPPPGQAPPPPDQAPPGSRPRQPPDQAPPGSRQPPQTATVADGTHPTGMHSCVMGIWRPKSVLWFVCTLSQQSWIRQYWNCSKLNLFVTVADPGFLTGVPKYGNRLCELKVNRNKHLCGMCYLIYSYFPGACLKILSFEGKMPCVKSIFFKCCSLKMSLNSKCPACLIYCFCVIRVNPWSFYRHSSP